MIVVLDDNKEKLDEMGIKYYEYKSTVESFLDETISGCIQTSMTYEEIDINEENFDKCYIYLTKNCPSIFKKIGIKTQKYTNEVFNEINNALKGNKEEILKTEISKKEESNE